ncbi:MAG: RagB/SusD family nutrient uptake outer membrane protein [Bacteroidales bacterium]|nr:RagB/SusD family nutrient uptake outer membrane protein [Bacteroidales bacterium]
MKKILLLAIAAVMALATSCNENKLNTNPTDAVSGEFMLENTNGGMMALNGTIRYLWQWGVTTTGNYHQCFGIQSYALMGDLMGEDMVMDNQGNGWFWYDYIYGVKSRYTSGAWRSYDVWNYYYTLISQVNYIIAAQETMQGPSADVDYIMGNAYALRAYSYLYLAMTFARSYIGHEDRLCVPIYTEPSSAGTKGKARSTNREVYGQAMSDINKAVELLGKGQAQQHCSHIDIYVAQGIKARIALNMGDYETAYAAATEAIKGATLTSEVLDGFNDATAKDVLWGAEIIRDQGTTNPQFLAHMDIAFDGYGRDARKACSAWLYDKIDSKDVRKGWWKYEALADGKTKGYQQYKFRFADANDPYVGADHIFMRVGEMYLTAAEAACRIAGKEGEAQQILNTFMSKRQEGYNCTKTGTALGTLTTDVTGSLLEEILLQRRIELWGEYGRIYDIKRLRQGFARTSAMGHPVAGLLNNMNCTDPESFDWVLTIPQTEIDANPAIVQNPVGSAPQGNTGDDPALTPNVE